MPTAASAIRTVSYTHLDVYKRQNQKVAEGGSVSFTITPKEGYEVATLVIDGMTVLPLTSYSFMNVDSNHTLYVTFREK